MPKSPVMTAIAGTPFDKRYLSTFLERQMNRNANIASVVRKARDIAFKTGRYDHYEDLISQGYLGLCESMQRYEPDRGIPLEFYANKRIEGSMKDYLRKELCEDNNTVEFDAPDNERNHLEEILFEHFRSRRSLESDVNFRLIVECLIEVYQGLSCFEKELINLIYCEGASFREIAAKFGVNASTICRNHRRIIEKFRREFAARGFLLAGV